MMSFWGSFIIYLELFLASICYFLKYERRKYFALRLLASFTLSVLLLCGISFLAEKFIVNDGGFNLVQTIYNTLRFLFNYVLLVFTAMFAYNVNFKRAFFGCASGYATQHLTRNLTSLIFLAFPVFGTLNIYLKDTLSIFIFYLPVDVLAYFLFVRKFKPEEYNDKYIFKLNILSLFILFSCIFISRIIKDFGDRPTYSEVAESLYAIICCAYALIIQFEIKKQNKMEVEMASLKQLWHEEKQQLLSKKEDIELINIKCHDIMHRLEEYRERLTEEEVNGLGKMIRFYDADVKTGNEVLDVILTSKSLHCNKEQIRLTCMGNGNSLDFLTEAEIYSLFDNAINNAITAVKELPPEKREISILLHDNGNLCTISVSNYYRGAIVFEDGLPQTTHLDKEYHGFGLKSIKLIANRHGGNIKISTENDIFELIIYLMKDKIPLGNE